MIPWTMVIRQRTQAPAPQRGVVRGNVRLALGRLPSGDRRLLELLTAHERPDYRAIGRTLDRPICSIGPTRRWAIDRLRRQPALLRLAPSQPS